MATREPHRTPLAAPSAAPPPVVPAPPPVAAPAPQPESPALAQAPVPTSTTAREAILAALRSSDPELQAEISKLVARELDARLGELDNRYAKIYDLRPDSFSRLPSVRG